MMTMTRRRAAALLGLAPGFAALREAAADAPVFRFGALLGLTDKGNWNATVMQRGIQMAVDEINGSGGIDGVRIEAEIEDHQGVPRAGVDAPYGTFTFFGSYFSRSGVGLSGS